MSSDGASSDTSVLDEFVEVLHFIWQTRAPAVGALTDKWRAADLFVIPPLVWVKNDLHRRLDKLFATTFST